MSTGLAVLDTTVQETNERLQMIEARLVSRILQHPPMPLRSAWSRGLVG